MKVSILAFSCALLSCAAFGEEAYPATVEEGFESLFNGKDLRGWYGSTIFAVEPYQTTLSTGEIREENVLACVERPGRIDRGNLLTRKEYENFVLRFEVLLPENGDCGIGLRVPNPTVNAAFEGMGEVQILDDGGSKFYDAESRTPKLKAPYRYSGSVFGIAASRRDNVNKQIWGKEKNFAGNGSYMRRCGLWNFFEIRVIGSEIEVVVNGTLVTKTNVAGLKGDGDTLDARSHLGLQNKKGHIAILGASTNVLLRNIRVLELPKDAKMDGVCPKMTTKEIAGFTAYFNGDAEQLKTMWKGVTPSRKFDNPLVRAAADPDTLLEMQRTADFARDAHWHVRKGVLFFDGFRGGYSLATAKDFKDFELWADWRLLSVTGDSGLYLRGSPQVQIWDAHNQWGIGSGGLYNNVKNPSRALAIADRLVGDWNRFHVIMRGEKVTVYLNGVLVVDGVTLENYWNRAQAIFPEGQIELQCHGDPIEWRNIFIREL